MTSYQITLLVVGLTGLLGVFVSIGCLVLGDRYGMNLSRRTREAVKLAMVSGIAFFCCITTTLLFQSGETWLGEVRYLPWIIAGAPVALIFGYIARCQAETLLYITERPRLRTFLSSVTYILLIDWMLTAIVGLSFTVAPEMAPEIPTGSLLAVLERVPLLAAEIVCLTTISTVFWKSSGPQTSSNLLRARNRLFLAGTMCWLGVEAIEMSFPLAEYFLKEREAVLTSAALTLMQALLLTLSIAFWLTGFIKHRSRTDLDIWRERFLEWSRLREMFGIARAKIRFQSNGLLMTHEYHLEASAKCLGLSETDIRKAVLTLHMSCVLSTAASNTLFSGSDLKVRRKDLLKCAVLHERLQRSRSLNPGGESRLTADNGQVSYGLGEDLLYEVMRPTLWVTQTPLQTDISRCPLWVQLAAVSAAYAGLLNPRNQHEVLASKKLDGDIIPTYDLSMELSARERIN